jgi:hypothetical protein
MENEDKVLQLNDVEKIVAEVTYPEGGYKAWLVVLGGWLCQFTTFGYTNAYGVYNGDISFANSSVRCSHADDAFLLLDYYTREYMTNQTSFALRFDPILFSYLRFPISSNLFSNVAGSVACKSCSFSVLACFPGSSSIWDTCKFSIFSCIYAPVTFERL